MLKEVGVEINGRIYYEDFVKMMAGTIGKQQREVSRIKLLTFLNVKGHFDFVLQKLFFTVKTEYF